MYLLILVLQSDNAKFYVQALNTTNMKILFTILLFTFGIYLTNANAQNIKSIEAEGNLESPKPCGCIELSAVTSENNPADILNGMGKCIEQKEFRKAARLFAIAGVYGTYDSYRVKDKSAHQALLVLQSNIFSKVSEDDKNNLLLSLQGQLKAGSEELSEICNAIRQVGMPKYFPRYMIQHGLQALTGKSGNGLVENFNSQESWDLSLKTYLHCGE